MNEIQLKALQCFEAAAKAQSDDARSRIAEILMRNRVGYDFFAAASESVRERARVVIHFHPDRLDQFKKTVIESLLEKGYVTNQFETGISGGSLTPFSGGPRDKWEERLFGGVYQKPGVRAADRPKYGALDLMNFSDGAAPRFGSCYFRLGKDVLKRCTFTNKDSVFEPDIFGTVMHPDALLEHLLLRAETETSVLGIEHPCVNGLLKRFSCLSDNRVAFSSSFGRTLDDYVEAQIHGPIQLRTDVDRLVADPSFMGTEIETAMRSLCQKYAIEMDWHAGFSVSCDKVPAEFRGPRIPVLAGRVAENGKLTASIIGKAAFSLAMNPEFWHDWAPFPETLQHIKQLWHVLAHFGEPLIRKPALIDAVIAIVEKEICRLSEIEKTPEETHPSTFDRNDLPLLQMILEVLESARSQETSKIDLNGKPRSFLLELFDEHARELPDFCRDIGRSVLNELCE
ncbi:MAG: DUF3626 domain-containing protein [Candidatus Riflebacteria bacterium]|nr:DUF3626 domain-containing protein [Candidatus Riflebacteria bacterium]